MDELPHGRQLIEGMLQHDAELKAEKDLYDEHHHPRLIESVLDSLLKSHAYISGRLF